MSKAQEMLDSDRCSLFLLDEKTGELWAKLRDDFQIRFNVQHG